MFSRTKEDLHYYEALRLKALMGVMHPDNDHEYRIRHIFREFSIKFHVPLHLVERLPLEEVLINYYEDKYENMEDEDLKSEIKLLLESRESFQARKREEDFQEAEAAQFAKFALDNDKKQKEKVKALNEIKPDIKIPFTKRAPETVFPKVDPNEPLIPPDINIQFSTEDINLDELFDPGSE